MKVKSLTDFAAQQAKWDDKGAEYAMWAAENIVGFPDNVSTEDMEKIHAGYLLTKAELVPDEKYVVEEGAWRLARASDSPTLPGRTLTFVQAMSYSGTEFGALRKESVSWHAAVKRMRDDGNKYKSNKWNRLVGLYNKLTKVGMRTANKTYAEWLDEILAQMVSKAKTATARGDSTAPSETDARAAVAAIRKSIG